MEHSFGFSEHLGCILKTALLILRLCESLTSIAVGDLQSDVLR